MIGLRRVSSELSRFPRQSPPSRMSAPVRAQPTGERTETAEDALDSPCAPHGPEGCDMQVAEILAQAGGLQAMAKDSGVSEADAARGAAALAPAILGGFKKQAQAQPTGLEGLGGYARPAGWRRAPRQSSRSAADGGESRQRCPRTDFRIEGREPHRWRRTRRRTLGARPVPAEEDAADGRDGASRASLRNSSQAAPPAAA